MSTFESSNDYRNYLAHHGVKGMKWGVRHDKIKSNLRKRRAKKYGVSEKDVDEIHESTKKKTSIVKKVGAGFGAFTGAAVGGTVQQMKKQHAKMIAMEALGTTGKKVFVGQSERNLLGTLNKTADQIYRLSPISSAAFVPLSAAAGSAAGYLGGMLYERVLEDLALSSLSDKRNNGAVRELREYDVRLKKE